ncbi:hypothetical protein PMAYCL1PPCAC_24671, partial [Pristionchus mayeri]
ALRAHSSYPHRFTIFTITFSGLTVIDPTSLIGLVVAVFSMVNRESNLISVNFSSMKASRMPRQMRGPSPKDWKADRGRSESSSHLNCRNSFASSPHTLSSMCIV